VFFLNFFFPCPC